MNIKELRELIKLVAEKQFAEFELEQSDFKLRIKRNSPPVIQYSDSQVIAAPNPTSAVAHAAAAAPPAASSSLQSAAAAVEPEEQLYLLRAPIVGTFYRAPSPTADPFVRIGDHVEPGTILCIIEAMKLMNEISSDVSGEIARIYAENGNPVEFGEPIFGIKMSS